MTGRRRRELIDSFRLLASDERWVLRDLLVGVLAFVVWAAGTGALSSQVAGAIGVPLGLASGEMPSKPAIAIFGVLWLVVPAIAVVGRVRQRMLNLRGNVEQHYRLDHPAALLAPPALLVATVLGVAVAMGAFPWYGTLLMVPVGLAVLVRTLAFSYRVYSFSHPLLVQVLLGLSTALLLASALAAVGTAVGRRSLVDQVVRTAGLPAWIPGTLAVEGVAVPGVAALALAPVVLASGYVLLQTIIAVAVRLLTPEVDRSKMRTGQRYPSFLPEATPVQAGTESTPTETGPTPTAPESSTSGATTTPDTSSDETTATAAGETDEQVAEDEHLDDVSNTRVFTPPADGVDGGSGGGSDTASDAGFDGTSDSTPGSPSADPGETRAVTGSGTDHDDEDVASTGADREHCSACGESFTVDTAVRFCPNCGTALDDD